MPKNNKLLLDVIVILIILSFVFFAPNNIFYKITKAIFSNKELHALLATLIAGLFGFVAAIIPFAIHLLSQKYDFIDKLKEENNFKKLIEPLFNRFLSFLRSMFVLFVFLLMFIMARDIIGEYGECFKEALSKESLNVGQYVIRCIVGIILIAYYLLVSDFLFKSNRLILDLKGLVHIFFQINTKEN